MLYNAAKTVFSRNGTGPTGHLIRRQRNESRHRPYTKINSEWIRDLKVKCKTIKLLEGDVEENPDDLGFGNDFSDTTSRA